MHNMQVKEEKKSQQQRDNYFLEHRNSTLQARCKGGVLAGRKGWAWQHTVPTYDFR